MLPLQKGNLVLPPWKADTENTCSTMCTSSWCRIQHPGPLAPFPCQCCHMHHPRAEYVPMQYSQGLRHMQSLFPQMKPPCDHSQACSHNTRQQPFPFKREGRSGPPLLNFLNALNKCLAAKCFLFTSTKLFLVFSFVSSKIKKDQVII